MKNRMKALRKSLGLTQAEFAAKLGIKRNTIANYETGRNAPIDAVLTLICRTFNVSEDWLRTGNGKMNLDTPPDAIDQLIREYGLDELDRSILSAYATLPVEERIALRDALSKMASGFMSQFSRAEQLSFEGDEFADEKEFLAEKKA